MSAISMVKVSAGQKRNWDFLRIRPSASIRISSDISVVYRIFYPVCKEAFFCGGNSPWPKPDHLTPSNEDIKKEWSYTSTPHIHFYCAYGKSLPLNVCDLSSPNFVTSYITNLLQHFIKFFYLLKLHTHTHTNER